MKYPIGIQSFDQIIEDGYVYVDKTEMIYSLVKEGKIYFLSRPRRFGKSLLVSTLKNYFLGRKELFKGLAIDRLEKDWLEYPVFHIDFNGSDFQEEGTLEKVIEEHISAWEKAYAILPDQSRDRGMRFIQVLREAHARVGRRAVVLIDEYDKPILDVLDTGLETVVGENRMSLEDRNRGILKGFYSVFKAADEHLQFVLLTGVTKFSQVSVFSGFNQPKDISMHPRYESLCGITQKEMESYFAESIAAIAARRQCSAEEMKRQLKFQYDGYHFGEEMVDIYNPFSLLNAFDSGRIDDYWFKSGTPTYLIRLLRHTRENLNEMTGRYYRTPEFVDYKADVEKPLPMIYQSGYLTIKGYDREYNTFLLDFPNNEVKNGFLSVIASDYLKPRTDINNWVQHVVVALRQGKPEEFGVLLTSFLSDIPYTMRRKENERERERYFHYTFYLILRLVSVYTVYTEKQQSEGRVDCIVETDRYIYIFEFKLDGTAADALRQIEEKGYARPYLNDPRRLYRIGVSFSSETGTVEEYEVEPKVR
ncbi:ATP-binding protein [Butyricimonas synergistica]|uniref:ATP-binding protein n=1 Tax=Butyricimonas synergistica TaxID=544644 RepID=UPI0003676A74|nr:ATP-binding protein [Butyricimonas synergistica]